MASPFEGKWQLNGSENFDEYLKAVGVGFMMRQLAKTATPTQEWTVTGDHYVIKTTTTFKASELQFDLGVEFDEEQLDGTKVRATVVKESDNKLVHTTKGERELRIVREVTGDELVMTLEILGGKNVTAVRKYKRV